MIIFTFNVKKKYCIFIRLFIRIKINLNETLVTFCKRPKDRLAAISHFSRSFAFVFSSQYARSVGSVLLFNLRSPVAIALCYYSLPWHLLLYCQVDCYSTLCVRSTRLFLFLTSSKTFLFLRLFKKLSNSIHVHSPSNTVSEMQYIYFENISKTF